MAAMTSEYEMLRKKKIEENNYMLRELGFFPISTTKFKRLEDPG